MHSSGPGHHAGSVASGLHNPSVCAAQVVPGFRVRTIPVLGTTPAVFGMAAAAHILCALAGVPLATEPLIRLQAEQYAVQLDRLAAREELLYGGADGLAVDIDDVSSMLYVTGMESVWCVVVLTRPSFAATCEASACITGSRCSIYTCHSGALTQHWRIFLSSSELLLQRVVCARSRMPHLVTRSGLEARRAGLSCQRCCLEGSGYASR